MPGTYVDRVWRHDPTLGAPARHRRACAYAAFVPEPLADLPLSLEVTVSGLIHEAEAAIRDLNDSAKPALMPLARLLLKTESIASSRIEGLQLGVRALARAEARSEHGGRVGPVTLEVMANIEAMEIAIEEAAGPGSFELEAILGIHRRLMAGAINADRIAGVVRQTQNWIGGNDYNPCSAEFVPPPPEEVPRLLDDLCAAINDDRLPPLVQAALVHAQFETIHPFADGNGRAGRALIHVVLRRRGVAPGYVPPISVVLAGARERYVDGLTQFRGDGVAIWIERFAEASLRAARLAESYLNAVRRLRDEWVERLEERSDAPRQGAAAWALIDVLPAYPIITARIAQAATSRSRPQLYAALDQLEAAGVLSQVSHGRRNRSWEAVGLLELLEGLEAGDSPAPGDALGVSAQ